MFLVDHLQEGHLLQGVAVHPSLSSEIVEPARYECPFQPAVHSRCRSTECGRSCTIQVSRCATHCVRLARCFHGPLLTAHCSSYSVPGILLTRAWRPPPFIANKLRLIIIIGAKSNRDELRINRFRMACYPSIHARPPCRDFQRAAALRTSRLWGSKAWNHFLRESAQDPSGITSGPISLGEGAVVMSAVAEGGGVRAGAARAVARVDTGVPIVAEARHRAGVGGAALEGREALTAASGVGVGGRLAAAGGEGDRTTEEV